MILWYGGHVLVLCFHLASPPLHCILGSEGWKRAKKSQHRTNVENIVVRGYSAILATYSSPRYPQHYPAPTLCPSNSYR